MLTYLIPVIPLAYGFDGVISHLRTYSPEELRTLTRDLSGPRYQWDIGQQRPQGAGPRITYIVGYPR